MAAKSAVLDVAYFTTGRARDLRVKLRELHDALKVLPQGITSTSAQHGTALRAIASFLVSAEVVGIKDESSRLVAACCLTDILRVFAPDCPYEGDDMEAVWALIAEGLACLSRADEWLTRSFFILESLATFGSCCLVVDFDELWLKLVTTLLNAIRPSHAAEVFARTVDVICTTLEECSSVPPAVCQALLEPFLQASDKPAAVTVMQRVLAREAERLQSVVGPYLVQLLSPEATPAQRKEGRQLVLAVATIDTTLLLMVMPEISQGLHVVETQPREKTVALLCDLFMIQTPCVGESYGKYLEEVLGRVHDKEPAIRLKVIDFALQLVKVHPRFTAVALSAVSSRICDHEDSIRAKTVQDLCKALVESREVFLLAPLKLFTDIGDRMQDKVVKVRTEAMTGLAQVYSQYSDELCGTDIPARGVPSKLDWIPSHVLKCFAFKELDIRLKVVQILDRVLLPQTDAEPRARAFMYMLQHLDAGSVVALEHVLRFRAACQIATRRLIEARAACTPAQRRDKTTPAALAEPIAMLAKFVPAQLDPHAVEHLKQLVAVDKDKVFESMTSLVDGCSTGVELQETRDSILSTVHSSVASALKPILRFIALHLVTADCMESCVNMASQLSTDDDSQATVVWNTLALLADLFPSVFVDQVSRLSQLAVDRSQPHRLAMLRVLASAAAKTRGSKNAQVALKSYGAKLKALCAAGDPGVAKAATSATLALGCRAEDLLNHAMDAMETTNENLASVLRCIATIARTEPALFVPERARLDTLVFIEGSVFKKPLSKYAAPAMISGLKACCNILRAMVDDDTADERALSLDMALYCIFGCLMPAHDRPSDFTHAITRLTAGDAAKVQAAAVSCALRLARHVKLDRTISVQHWHYIGRTLQEAPPIVRDAVITKLSKAIGPRMLPLRYMPLPVLSATDSDGERRKRARKALTTMITERRRLYDEQRQLGDMDAKQTASLMPESCVPFALHLLAHSPEFPDSVDKSFAPQVTSLSWLLDALLAVSPNTDSIPLLRKMMTQIKDCDDVLQPGSTNVFVLADIAMSLIGQRIRVDTNLVEYRGSVFFPRTCFTSRDGPTQVTKSFLPKSFINASGSVKLATSSPVKRPSPGKATAAASPALKAAARRRRSKPSKQEDDAAPIIGSRRSSRVQATETVGKYAESEGSDVDELYDAVGAAMHTKATGLAAGNGSATAQRPSVRTPTKIADSDDGNSDFETEVAPAAKHQKVVASSIAANASTRGAASIFDAPADAEEIESPRPARRTPTKQATIAATTNTVDVPVNQPAGRGRARATPNKAVDVPMVPSRDASPKPATARGRSRTKPDVVEEPDEPMVASRGPSPAKASRGRSRPTPTKPVQDEDVPMTQESTPRRSRRAASKSADNDEPQSTQESAASSVPKRTTGKANAAPPPPPPPAAAAPARRVQSKPAPKLTMPDDEPESTPRRSRRAATTTATDSPAATTRTRASRRG